MPTWQTLRQAGRLSLREVPLVRSVQSQPHQGRSTDLRAELVFQFHGRAASAASTCAACPFPAALTTPSSPTAKVSLGKANSFLRSQSFLFSFDLFQGDTSFRPVDFRIRFTPEINLNFLQTRERGLVNVDPAKGINRFDDPHWNAGRLSSKRRSTTSARILISSPSAPEFSSSSAIFADLFSPRSSPAFGSSATCAPTGSTTTWLSSTFWKRHEQRAEYLQPAPSAGLRRATFIFRISLPRATPRNSASITTATIPVFTMTTMVFWCAPRRSATS